MVVLKMIKSNCEKPASRATDELKIHNFSKGGEDLNCATKFLCRALRPSKCYFR